MHLTADVHRDKFKCLRRGEELPLSFLVQPFAILCKCWTAAYRFIDVICSVQAKEFLLYRLVRESLTWVFGNRRTVLRIDNVFSDQYQHTFLKAAVDLRVCRRCPLWSTWSSHPLIPIGDIAWRQYFFFLFDGELSYVSYFNSRRLTVCWFCSSNFRVSTSDGVFVGLTGDLFAFNVALRSNEHVRYLFDCHLYVFSVAYR